MISFHKYYTHIKCDDPECRGNVRRTPEYTYVCDRCGKTIPYHYVKSKCSIEMINEKTGWVYPMAKKE